jgi:general nucleoside transport system permease protein
MSDAPTTIQRPGPSPRVSNWLSTGAVTLGIVVLAFLLGAILILLTGANPIRAYSALLYAAFGTTNGFAETMVKATPLILAGLGVMVAYRAQFWNIGAEGQIYLGSILATIVGISFRGLPLIIHLPLTLLAGMAGGALWGFIPGFLKARYRVNEVITTLLLNYIAIGLTGYLVHTPLRDQASGIPISPQLAISSWLPILIPRTRFHLGIILAILAAFLVHWLLTRTVLGYQIRAIGDGRRAAQTGGIHVARTIVLTMLISGALAGLAGAVEIAGVQHRLVEGFSPGYGYLAIAVALLGRLNPFGVVLAGILFAALLNGADAMQRTAGVPITVVFVIEGLVILFVAARVQIRLRRSSRA